MLFFNVFFVLQSLYYVLSYQISDFTKPFSSMKSGIYQVDVGLDENYTPLAFGDFNNDKSQDIVALNKNKQLTILYWSTDGNKFSSQQICDESQSNVVGVIPGDFLYDGHLHLLVVTQQNNQYSNYMILQTSQTLKSGYNSFNCNNQPFSSQSFPIAADFYGNHSTTLLYTQDDVRLIGNGINSETTQFQELVSDESSCLKYSGNQNSLLISNSVVDITGDCRADLFVISSIGDEQFIEFYSTTANKNLKNRYCLTHYEPIQKNIQIISANFVDINFDGLIDQILIVQSNDEQYIVSQYNNQKPGASSSTPSKNPCRSQTTYTYPYSNISLQNSSYTIISSMNGYKANNNSIYRPNLRFGDYKCTGYPGALLTVTKEQETFTYYVENDYAPPDTQLVVNSKRFIYLETNPNIAKDFAQIYKQQSLAGAWFDYGENGRLDFIIYNDESIMAFYNYLSNDELYLKALGLDGSCQQSKGKIWCVGAMYYGFTYMFSVTDLEGIYSPKVGVQLYQSSFTSLQLPYAYMGLSRTNNYIGYLNFNIPLTPSVSPKSYTPLIPNSQLILNPYGNDSDSWTIAIFIEPTKAIIIVVIITIVILILLGAVIIWKHLKEKEEDKKNQETFFQMFR